MFRFSFLSICAALWLASCAPKPMFNPKSPEYAPIVEMVTDSGTIEIQLFAQTPKHRDNFVKLVKDKYYDGMLFHRVIKDFMVQGGDPDSKSAKDGQMLGQGGPGYTIPAEFVDSLIHVKGALAAARMGDQMNPKKESSGSQFYIVQGKAHKLEDLQRLETYKRMKYTDAQLRMYQTVGGAPHLDREYTVFGEVKKGLDVVDKIGAVAVDNYARPLKNVKIISVRIKKG